MVEKFIKQKITTIKKMHEKTHQVDLYYTLEILTK